MVCGTRCNGRQYVTQDQLTAEIAQIHSLVRSAGLQGSSLSSYGWNLYGSSFTEEVPASHVFSAAGQKWSLTEHAVTILSRGQTKLIWQADGNLVLYDGTTVLWASETGGKGGQLIIQGDGNIIVDRYINGSSPAPLYQSGSVTTTAQEHTLAIMPSKNLVMFNAAGEKIWSALQNGPVPSKVEASGLQMTSLANQWLELRFQASDGNLVLYDHGKVTWASGACEPGGKYKLIFQGDGNLVVYTEDGAVCKSVTKGPVASAKELVLQGDGNLVILDEAGRPLWSALH